MCFGYGAILRSRQNLFGPLILNFLDPPLMESVFERRTATGKLKHLDLNQSVGKVLF